MKKCTKCGEDKELSEFSINGKNKDGKSSRCKTCIKEIEAKWYRENPDKVKQKTKSRYLKFKASGKPRRQGDPVKARARRDKWYRENPDKVRAYNAKQVRELSKTYVSRLLGIKVCELTPELLELKRAQLEMYKLTKQLNKEIQNGIK